MRVINNNNRSASVKSIISGALHSSKKSESILLSPNEEYDLIPQVKKTESLTNELGVSDLYLTLRMYCLVDVDTLKSSDCNEIQMFLLNKPAGVISTEKSTNIIRKTSDKLIKLSSKNKNENDKSDNIVTNSRGNKSLLEKSKNKASRNSNPLLDKTMTASLLSNQAMFNLKKLVKPKVLDSIESSESQTIEKFITKFTESSPGNSFLKMNKKRKKKIQINERLIEKTESKRSDIEKIFDKEKLVFKKNYQVSIGKGVDPISLFIDTPKHKKSMTDKRKGRVRLQDLSKKNKTDSSNSLIDVASKYISINDQKVKKYSNITYETQSYLQLESEVIISLAELRKFGPTLKFIFYAKNANNIKIESMSLTISIDKILNQLNKSSKDYQINSLRKNNGVSKLSIQNNSSNKLNLRLLYKNYTNYASYLKSDYRNLDSVSLLKNNLITYNSGYSAIGAIKVKRDKIKNIDSVIYRSLLTYDGVNFDNAKSAGDAGISLIFENIPELAMTTVTSNEGDSINIYIKNPSSNIAEIKVFKWVLNKSGARIRKNEIYSSFKDLTAGSPAGYKKLSKSSKEVIMKDYDVFDGNFYEYSAECKLKNGEIKMINSSSVVQYQSRSNIVNVNLKSITTSDNNVEINLGIKKVQTEIDKVLRSVFGEVFELFSDDLKIIKDIQNFSYSVLVERLDTETGESFKLGTFPIELKGDSKEGELTLFDSGAPLSSKLIYTIIPRIALTSDIISQTNELISNIGKKQGNNKINFSYASIRQRSKKNKLKTVSSIGSKYNSFENLKKGLATNDSYYLNEFNLDFFGNRSPGDILNVECSLSNNLSGSTNDLEIELKRIKEIKYMGKNESKDKISDPNVSSTRLFDMQFITRSNIRNVDFYAIFISDNNNVYLDGALHVNDVNGEYSEHRYLLEHNGSVGRINYYALPVLKDGSILSPVLIGSNILE